MPRTEGLSTLLSLLAVVLYVAAIEWLWGWPQIFEQWRTWSLINTLGALCLIFSTYLLRAWRLRDYFRAEPQVEMLGSTRITLIHNLANNLLPMRSGEASFPLLMKSTYGLSLARTSGALLYFRALDLYVLLAIGAAAACLHLRVPVVVWLWLPLWLLAPLLGIPIQQWLQKKLAGRKSGKLSGLLEGLLAGVPTTAFDLWRSLLITWANWLLKIAVFAWVVANFGGLQLTAATAGAIGGELSSILPLHAPGGIGTYEAGVVAFAALFGASPGESLGAAVNLHLFIIISTLIGGLLAPLIRSQPNKASS